MTHIAKVIEIIGSSDKGWEDADQEAVNEARKTLHGIHGIEVMDMTATVDENTGKIAQYRASVKLAFGVEH
jgi:flavin-binding protein dodecin